MLRLNLLRDLTPPHKPSKHTKATVEGRGPLRAVLLILLLLLATGGVSLYLTQPQWIGIGDGGAAAKAQADSRRRAEAVQNAASRTVEEGLTLGVAWLDQLEMLPTENGTWMATLSSFTPPDRFLLRGTARTGEALSGLQEAIVLFPGGHLRDSRAEKIPGTRDAYTFEFSGTVALRNEDSIPTLDRTLPASRLEVELDNLRQAASAVGITLSPPQAGPVTVGGGLEARSYRISGSCDSTASGAIRMLLEGERLRGSPFGLRRLTLENRDGHVTVFLDIMTFIR